MHTLHCNFICARNAQPLDHTCCAQSTGGVVCVYYKTRPTEFSSCCRWCLMYHYSYLFFVRLQGMLHTCALQLQINVFGLKTLSQEEGIQCFFFLSFQGFCIYIINEHFVETNSFGGSILFPIEHFLFFQVKSSSHSQFSTLFFVNLS